MPWQFVLNIRDVNGDPVAGAALQLSTWTGKGDVLVKPRTSVPDSSSLTLGDDVTSVVVDLIHQRYAPLAISMLRSSGELAWRWTDPRQQIATGQNTVTVTATLFRTRAAPLVYIPEDELKRRAANAKTPLEAKALKAKKPVPPVHLDDLAGVLRDQNNFYRNSGGGPVPLFHLIDPNPLGEENAAGWKRYQSTVHPNLTPWKTGHIQMIEYGEIGTNGPYGPRLLAGIYLPEELLKVGRKTIDFNVWFTPNTNPPIYPAVEFPFRGAYPYALMALGDRPPYAAGQPYVEVSYAHLNPVQHFLAYQMFAARRACAIVIPSAPSGHFELWESPSTLMRMLTDICRWLPRDDDGRTAKVHPSPPAIGRVGVSGFSAAGEHLLALVNGQRADMHYTDPVWGSSKDAAIFDRAWGELWSVDNNLGSQFLPFVNSAAAWSRQYDRHFCVYKNAFTGPWHPDRERDGEFARALKNSDVVTRGSGSNWAVSVSERSGRLHAISVSQSYVVWPADGEEPLMNGNTHENMPRVFFGHAAVTSRYAKLA